MQIKVANFNSGCSSSSSLERRDNDIKTKAAFTSPMSSLNNNHEIQVDWNILIETVLHINIHARNLISPAAGNLSSHKTLLGTRLRILHLEKGKMHKLCLTDYMLKPCKLPAFITNMKCLQQAKVTNTPPTNTLFLLSMLWNLYYRLTRQWKYGDPFCTVG